jgi:Lon protease-like protein
MESTIQVPVIHLPNVIFFPKTALPLYIMDPVYEDMIKKSIEDGTHIGLCLEDPSLGESSNIFTIGVPLIVDKLDDGTLKVLVHGVTKVQAIQVVQHLPYPIYECEGINENPDIDDETRFKLNRLHIILDLWLEKNVLDKQERDNFMATITEAEQVVGYITTFLVRDRKVRQLLLENNSFHEKINLLNILLKDYLPFQEDSFVTDAILDYEDIEKHAKCAH